jgi:Family of unknown function (DUF5302)
VRKGWPEPAGTCQAETMATSHDDTGNSGPETDPVKDKYREALERKHRQHADQQTAAEAREASKVHGEHGAAGVKRTFRRKSG